MPRNGSGTYALPKPPFQPQTMISSADVNATFSDIGNALTGSVPRDGQAGMTGVLPLAASGFVYANDDDTGVFRSNANEQTIKCGGQNVLVIKTDGLFTGAGTEISSFVLGVPYPWIFATPAPGTVFAAGQPCTSAYPRLRALLVADGAPFGNNGTDPLFPNLCGVTIAGRTTMGGSDRGNLTGGSYVGATIGAQSVTLSESQIPSHSHTGSGATSTDGNHSHSGSGTTTSAGDHAHSGTGATSYEGNHYHTGGGTTSATGGHSHTASGTTSGESSAHVHTGSGTTGGMNANNPHYHDLSYTSAPAGIIGSGQVGGSANTLAGLNGLAVTSTDIGHGHPYSFTTSNNLSDHTHSFSLTTSSVGDHSHTYSFTTSTVGEHNHSVSITTNTAGVHSHTYSFATSTNGAHNHAYSFTTSATGGGGAHDNVQPTIILNYIMRAA